jgi:hypothetical protein
VDKPIVWFFDENPSELQSYAEELRHLLPSSIDVRGMPPFPRKEDYFESILGHPNTACILIDQKIKGTGANYLGIDLARALRQVNKKVPIYILTNWAKQKDQFVGSEWSVEEIIAKDELIKDETATILIARMVRRIDVYTDILADRERRFSELLRKSLTTELSASEIAELEDLQFERSASILAAELGQIIEMEQAVQRYKHLLQEFQDTGSLSPIPPLESPNVEP